MSINECLIDTSLRDSITRATGKVYGNDKLGNIDIAASAIAYNKMNPPMVEGVFMNSDLLHWLLSLGMDDGGILWVYDPMVGIRDFDGDSDHGKIRSVIATGPSSVEKLNQVLDMNVNEELNALKHGLYAFLEKNSLSRKEIVIPHNSILNLAHINNDNRGQIIDAVYSYGADKPELTPITEIALSDGKIRRQPGFTECAWHCMDAARYLTKVMGSESRQ